MYSLEFQVIVFLRQKLVERYIGVDGVNFNALGHLCRETKGRKGGRETCARPRRRTVTACTHTAHLCRRLRLTTVPFLLLLGLRGGVGVGGVWRRREGFLEGTRAPKHVHIRESRQNSHTHTDRRTCTKHAKTRTVCKHGKQKGTQCVYPPSPEASPPPCCTVSAASPHPPPPYQRRK